MHKIAILFFPGYPQKNPPVGGVVYTFIFLFHENPTNRTDGCMPMELDKSGIHSKKDYITRITVLEWELGI